MVCWRRSQEPVLGGTKRPPEKFSRRGGHRCSRGRRGAHPSRVLPVRNVETPSRSKPRLGRPTVRKAEVPGGRGMIQEANVGRPKGQRKSGIGNSTHSRI